MRAACSTHFVHFDLILSSTNTKLKKFPEFYGTRAVGIRCADYATLLYPQKLALALPSSGGRSVGTVRSRTKATEFIILLSLLLLLLLLLL
jgi:hypothetical protein